jgi:zinc transporter ZupT
MTMVAYMIIFGDALHNFVDGMSIGAGYSKDLSAGLGISIAVACEEFPHELGETNSTWRQYIYIFFPMARQPLGGLGRLIFRGFIITL